MYCTYYCMKTNMYFGIKSCFLPNKNMDDTNLTVIQFKDETEKWVYPKLMGCDIIPKDAVKVNATWDDIIGWMYSRTVTFHDECLELGAISVNKDQVVRDI